MHGGRHFPAFFASALCDTPGSVWNTFSESGSKKCPQNVGVRIVLESKSTEQTHSELSLTNGYGSFEIFALKWKPNCRKFRQSKRTCNTRAPPRVHTTGCLAPANCNHLKKNFFHQSADALHSSCDSVHFPQQFSWLSAAFPQRFSEPVSHIMLFISPPARRTAWVISRTISLH